MLSLQSFHMFFLFCGSALLGIHGTQEPNTLRRLLSERPGPTTWKTNVSFAKNFGFDFSSTHVYLSCFLSRSCAFCKQSIYDTVFTLANGKYWHEDHFVCCVCRQPFRAGKYYNIDNLFYCEVHKHQVIRTKPETFTQRSLTQNCVLQSPGPNVIDGSPVNTAKFHLRFL